MRGRTLDDGGVWREMFGLLEETCLVMVSILVVDDSKVQRTLARFICEDAGYEVLEASDGRSGIATAASQECDLILLDLQMPDLSGQEVLAVLSERGITTPVIILTADDATPIREECLALGAARAVQKPSEAEELIALVNAVLSEAAAGPVSNRGARDGQGQHGPSQEPAP